MAADVQVTFDRPSDNNRAMGVTLRRDGEESYGKRITRVHPTSERLQAYTGTFYSDELDTVYTVSVREGKLFMRYPRGETEMMPTVADLFNTSFRRGEIEYQCKNDGDCDSFSFSNGRVRNLLFVRVDLKPRHS